MNTPAANTGDPSEGEGVAPGSEFYYTFLFERPVRRARLQAAAALGNALIGVPEGCSDPGLARIKLAWWREELGRLAEGRSRHPLTQALQQASGGGSAAAGAALGELALAVEAGMALAGGTDEAALRHHCEATGGRLWALLGELGTFAEGTAAAPARAPMVRLGALLERLRLTLETRRDLGRGWLRLPREALARHGLDAATLAGQAEHPAVLALFRETLAGLDRESGDCAHALRDTGAPLCAHTALALARARLGEIQRDGGRLLTHRVLLTPLRSLWVAWRTRRRVR